MAYIYRHIRTDTNEVFYIGIGNDKSYKRAKDYFKRNSFWKKVFNKTEYIIEIIEDGLTWEEACEREQYWIKFYGRRDLKEGTLVNMTNGGEGCCGLICSEAHKLKISKVHKGKKLSDETKQKLRESHTGKKLSKEIKNKMSKTRLLIGNTNPGKIIIGDGIEYKTAAEAARVMGIYPSAIFYRLNNKKWKNWYYKNK
jgi:hypothetical protein